MRATVLCYNLKGTTKGRKIGLIFGFLGYRVRHVEEKEYLLPVGEVAEGRTTESINEEAGVKAKEIEAVFQDEMLLMCPENERMLDQALQRMRKEKVQVPLKAVLTEMRFIISDSVKLPTSYISLLLTEMNKNWTSVALHDEIMREHEKMTGGK